MVMENVRQRLMIAGLGLAVSAVPVWGFATNTVSGLEVWLKADSGVATNAGGVVTTWSDQSGKGHDGAATSGGNPRFLAASSTLGGQPSLSFDGSDSGISLGNLSASFPTAATLFVVTAINDTLYNVFVTRDNSTYWRWDGDTYAYPGPFRGSRLEHYASTPASGACLFQVDSSASLWRMFTNGISLGTASADYNAGDNYRLGYGQGAGGFRGDIAEVLIYSKALSSAEAVKVGAYLVDKYALDLPIVDPDMPAINNAAGVSGVTDASAVLNGSLVRTGSSATAVSVYYGPADGGTDPASWAVSHDFGVSGSTEFPAAYDLTASSLTPDTGYYYTYACSNASETVWPKTRQTFITGNVWIGKIGDPSEIGLVPGTVMVYRAATATNCPLKVNYHQTGGTAVSGQDFAALSGQVTIPVGATNTPLVIAPLPNWGRQTESTLELTLDAGGYLIGSASNVSLTIANDPVPAAPTNTWVATSAGNASTDANWSLGHAPQEGEPVLLGPFSVQPLTWDLTNAVGSWLQTADYTGKVTISTTFGEAFPQLHITKDCDIQGGTWTHPENGATEAYRIRARVDGAFTLGSAATINVDLKGYGRGQGPGAGSAACANGVPSASYGGMGGDAFNVTYGSCESPTNLGSGGWESGGGAVWLNVGGVATINGRISARPICSLATGSGGSIFIQAGTLDGSGTLDVSSPYCGWIQRGGGGGRIAVILENGNSFGPVKMVANGGQSQDGVSGAAGTIYLQTSTQAEGTGTLIIDNAGVQTLTQTLVTPSQSNLNKYSSLIITNKAVLGLNTNTALNLGSPNLFCYGPSQSFIATPQTAGMNLPPTWQLQNCTLQIYANLNVPGSLTITNATLEMVSSGATNITIGTNLVIAAGGILTHAPNGDSEANRIAMVVGGDITIDAGGAIDVTGKGYAPGCGPGKGHSTNGHQNPAASHGGLGTPNPGVAGQPVTYGSLLAPTNSGSGAHMPGGGAVEIHVAGTSTINGSILAQASLPSLAKGAGGSIYLETGHLAGIGTIDASATLGGWWADPWNYGGGGGRVSVILRQGTGFGSVTMHAYGTYAINNTVVASGGAGTLYKQTASQQDGSGVLTVNNRGVTTSANITTQIPAYTNGDSLASLKYVTLVATNAANVEILSDLTMGDLFLQDDSSKLRLNGHTLSLKARKHADWGTEDRVVYGGGQIVWMIAGSIIMVY